jgi:hypothetical protein
MEQDYLEQKEALQSRLLLSTMEPNDREKGQSYVGPKRWRRIILFLFFYLYKNSNIFDIRLKTIFYMQK